MEVEAVTCYAIQYENGKWCGKVVDSKGDTVAIIGSQDGLNRDEAEQG